MNDSLKKSVLEVLNNVIDSEKGVVSSLQVSDNGEVVLIIEVDSARGTVLEDMRVNAEKVIASISGVNKVSVILTAEQVSSPKGQKGSVLSPSSDPHGMSKNLVVDVNAKHIILVASGKGGVGKSTVAANLAVSLAKSYKVGLLDADIYGPSQPLMMGGEAYKPSLTIDKKLIPLEKYGIKIMSIGFMVDKSKALIWRGAMMQKAIYQMIRDVDWGSEGDPLDYLIIDMPPGTGDVQLTLAQKLNISGAVIVSTPQDIALIDARRAVDMFNKVNVPVLGLVENMSVHICSNCGYEEHIFGYGGAEAEAKELGVSFLGAIPLSKNIREFSDNGTPIVLAEPESNQARAFEAVAKKVISALACSS